MTDFVAWFKSQGGKLDETAMKIDDVPGCGRGAIALRDIQAGHTLFSIPREMTLSLRTSNLPSLFGSAAWKQFGLHVGWAGLILCMMWEEVQGSSSRWNGYLSILPSHFDTPMFWSTFDLEELKGTAVVDKIGKADAERDYHQKLVPAMNSRPDLFPPESKSQFCSLERYHTMGSRILSRSFQVSKWDGAEADTDENTDDAPPEANTSVDSTAMDTDDLHHARQNDAPQETLEEAHDDDDDEDDEDAEESDPADVAMVPMADMLNARFEFENAKLFYEEFDLKMISTKNIRAGDQIWNTYGDLPNAELLRRYGHVDVLPLSDPLSGDGNPADGVEVKADLVLQAAASKDVRPVLQERIDWWLENVDDDTFVIFTDCEIPEELISLTLVLLQSSVDWEKTQRKGKLPKPVSTVDVLSTIAEVLALRLSQYPTSVEADEALLTNASLSRNQKNATIVRLGEKRILVGTLQHIHTLIAKMNAFENGGGVVKRKRTERDSNPEASGKRSRR